MSKLSAILSEFLTPNNSIHSKLGILVEYCKSNTSNVDKNMGESKNYYIMVYTLYIPLRSDEYKGCSPSSVGCSSPK